MLSALAEAQQGISSDAGNYFGAFTSTASETNFYFQFHGPAGAVGIWGTASFLDNLLASRNDPRRTEYFSLTRQSEVAQCHARRSRFPAAIRHL